MLNSTCKDAMRVHAFTVKQDRSRRVPTMKTLDQGHLHSKLEVRGLTCARIRTQASTVGGEHFRIKPFEQLVNSY
jgi:hypothetical protein